VLALAVLLTAAPTAVSAQESTSAPGWQRPPRLVEDREHPAGAVHALDDERRWLGQATSAYSNFVGRQVIDEGNSSGVQTPVCKATGTTLAGTVQANCVYGSGCGAALGTLDPTIQALDTLSCVGNVASSPSPPHECRSSEKDPIWRPDGSALAFTQTTGEGCNP
jgi:hypothetical protein